MDDDDYDYEEVEEDEVDECMVEDENLVDEKETSVYFNHTYI